MLNAFSALFQDIRYALRTFSKNPGFVAMACISIGLGIAANSTIFSIANAALFGDLPVREPQQLVTVTSVARSTLSYPDFRDFQKIDGVFEGIAGDFPVVPVSLSAGGRPERIWGQLVTGNYFDVTGARPNPGRGFTAEEGDPGRKQAVVVLGHGLWQRRFAGDPDIAGKTVLMDGYKFTVVGVAPKGFRGVERGLLPEFFVPLSAIDYVQPAMADAKLFEERKAQWLMLTARLKPGVGRKQALAALNAVNARISHEFRKEEKVTAMRLETAGGLPGGSSPVVSQVMAGLMVVVGLVLMIACANVANLLLARAAARQREIGVRLALGASRGRLIRQLLTESVLLSFGGAALGLLLTSVATQALAKLELPIPVPIAFDFSADFRVFAYTAALAMVTGILFGLAPTLRATRAGLVPALKDETVSLAGFRRFGLHNGLVVMQVTLSLFLLVGAGLFLRSLQNASNVRLGFGTHNILMLSVDPQLHHYTPEQTAQFYNDVRQRIGGIPGVRSMSYVDMAPLSFGGVTMDYEGPGAEGKRKRAEADVYSVGDGYFETMNIPVLRGRPLRTGSAGNARTAVINEQLAKQLFPVADPIGQQVFQSAMPGQQREAFEVIGVVANSKSRTIGEDTRACLFRALGDGSKGPGEMFGTTLLIKTTGDPRTMSSAVEQQINALDQNLPVFSVETMDTHVEKAMLLPRLAGMLFSVFGLTGLILASVGLYGMISYAVRRRTREIGIRMALGAPRAGVLKMVAWQGLSLVLIGMALGLALSLAGTRLTASVLYGISPTDPITFIGVALVLLLVALVAVLTPAIRASRLDPMAALRYE